MPTTIYSATGTVADTQSALATGLNGSTWPDANVEALAVAAETVEHTRGKLTTTSVNEEKTPTEQNIPVFPDAVSDGLALTHNPTTTNQLQFGYDAGKAQIGDTVYTYVAGVKTVTPDAANPRIALICAANATDSVVVVHGTAAASPVPPAIPANNVPLAVVYIPANAVAGGSDVTFDEQSYLTPTLRGLPAAPSVGAVAYWDGTKWAIDSTLQYDAANKLLNASSFGQKGKAVVNASGDMALSAAFEVVDSSGGVIARALPTFADVPDDFVFEVLRLGANNVTVSTDAANAFNNGAVATPYTIAVDGNSARFRKEASLNTWVIL